MTKLHSLQAYRGMIRTLLGGLFRLLQTHVTTPCIRLQEAHIPTAKVLLRSRVQLPLVRVLRLRDVFL